MNLQKELKKLDGLEKSYLQARETFMEKWADFVRTNPRWKTQHAEFINQEMRRLQEEYKEMTPEEYLRRICPCCGNPKR